jgi:hypothetical protein
MTNSSRPQRVRVPWRVVASSHYADATVTTYIKVAALARRVEGCEAGVAYLASILPISRSSVERALTQLGRPAPDDDVVELTSTRRTLPGGRGHTAVRRPRAVPRAERFVLVPSRVPEMLPPRQVRAYTAIAYAVATGQPLTLGELGAVLRHRSGERVGQPLSDTAGARVVAALEEAGWISVDRRAGERGRHVYTVHDQPFQQLDLTADLDDGSGDHAGEGSLATEEDHQTDSPEPTGGPIRRRRGTGSEPVDNPAPQVPAALRRGYAGPQLSLAPRIWRVLQPVAPLLPGLSPYVVRQLAWEVGRQLDQGIEPERLRWRLEHRYATTEAIRDPGRWLLGAAVVRNGCGLPGCESGVLWRTGMRCEVCADLRLLRAATAAAPELVPASPALPRPAGAHSYVHDRRGACARCDMPAAHRRHLETSR